MSIRGILKRSVKKAALPLMQRRWIIERARYLGTEILTPQAGNDRISECLRIAGPMAAGKMGNVELGGLQRYIRYRSGSGLCENWGGHAKLLYMNAGVYPATAETFSRFSVVFSEALGSLDVLAVWYQPGENRVRLEYAPRATPISLTGLEPFYHSRPWSKHLAGKRVLVVTPFANTVLSQYTRRTEIWAADEEILPEFELDTLRCPLSAGLVNPIFPDWCAALDAMRDEMSRRSFDVAIIGAGAWGIPLASHAKKIGRIGIHLGGPTQLLFGIRGGRWDQHPIIRNFMNDAWVRPSADDRPETFRSIENGCYW